MPNSFRPPSGSDDFYLKTDKTRQIALSTIPVGRIGTQEDSK